MFCAKQQLIYSQCWNLSPTIIGASIYIIYVNNFISSHLKLLVEPFQHLHIVNKKFHQAPVNMLKRTVSQYSSRHRNLLLWARQCFILNNSEGKKKNLKTYHHYEGLIRTDCLNTLGTLDQIYVWGVPWLSSTNMDNRNIMKC